jgi:hypothetical protein
MAVDSTAVDMPDLSTLRGRPLLRAMFINFFGGFGISEVEGSYAVQDIRNALRLVDKGIAEYELAAADLRAYTDRKENIPQTTLLYVEAANHLENMINAMHRACLLLDRLKRAKEVDLTNDDLLRPPEVEQIAQLRHASEHVDTFVRTGEIAYGEDMMPRAWCEGLSFAGKRVSYRTIARWLQKLNAAAEKIVH